MARLTTITCNSTAWRPLVGAVLFPIPIPILFYSILFYSILFYSILFYSIIYSSTYSFLFYCILFYSLFLFYSILFPEKHIANVSPIPTVTTCS